MANGGRDEDTLYHHRVEASVVDEVPQTLQTMRYAVLGSENVPMLGRRVGSCQLREAQGALLENSFSPARQGWWPGWARGKALRR